MAKLVRFGLALAVSLSMGVVSSNGRAQPAPDAVPAGTDRGAAGIRGGNITSTGETVPNPGASQSGGTTPLDRGIQREDDRIQNGICKGC